LSRLEKHEPDLLVDTRVTFVALTPRFPSGRYRSLLFRVDDRGFRKILCRARRSARVRTL